MNHYFSNNKNLKSGEIETEYIFKFTKFIFITDIGVFAKDGVDAATNILLENLPEIKKSSRVLDIGCGYGTVGVVLSRIYGCELVMSDVNERALDLAERNLKLNGASAGIIKSDGFENIAGKFDYIILNPPIHAGKSIIYKIYGDAREYLTPGGAFYLVIRKKHGALSHKQKLEEIFGGENLSVLYYKKGVFVFEAKKN
jgi:16S rRNA (guanine1207-N2)-methyltransferase